LVYIETKSTSKLEKYSKLPHKLPPKSFHGNDASTNSC
jgi:hypothetical protein